MVGLRAGVVGAIDGKVAGEEDTDSAGHIFMGPVNTTQLHTVKVPDFGAVSLKKVFSAAISMQVLSNILSTFQLEVVILLGMKMLSRPPLANVFKSNTNF